MTKAFPLRRCESEESSPEQPCLLEIFSVLCRVLTELSPQSSSRFKAPVAGSTTQTTHHLLSLCLPYPAPVAPLTVSTLGTVGTRWTPDKIHT